MKYDIAHSTAVDCRPAVGPDRPAEPVTWMPRSGRTLLAGVVLLAGWAGLLMPLPAPGQSAGGQASPPALGRDRGLSAPEPGPAAASRPASAATPAGAAGAEAGADTAGTEKRPAARPRRSRSFRPDPRPPAPRPGSPSGGETRPSAPAREPAPSTTPRGPEVLVTSESITHRIRMAPNGVVVVEFPLADAIYAIHPGNQNIIEVDIDRDSKPNDPLVFRPGPAFDPLLKTQTVHSLQFVSGLFVTLIFEPTQRIEENDHRVILQYDIASIRAARARKGLATNLLRRPVSPLIDEDPRLQPMPSVVPLSTSTSLEPVASGATPGSTSDKTPETPAGKAPEPAKAPAKVFEKSGETPVESPAAKTSGSGKTASEPALAGDRQPGVTGTAGATGTAGTPPAPASRPPDAPSVPRASPAPPAGATSGTAAVPAPSPLPAVPPAPSLPPPAPAPGGPATAPAGGGSGGGTGGGMPVPGRSIALAGPETPVVGVISGETGALVLPSMPGESPASSRSRRSSRTPAAGGAPAGTETPLQQLDDRPTPQMQLLSPSRPIRGEPGLPPGSDVPGLPRRNMTAAEREKYRLITEYYQTLGISVATVHRLQLDLEEKIANHRQQRSVDWLASLDVRTAQKNFPRWPVMVSFVEIADDSDFPGIRRYVLSITVHEKAPRPLYINSLDPDVFIITRNERVIVNTERLIPLVTLAGNPSTVIRPGETAYFGVAIPRPTLSDNQMLEIAFIDAEKANRPILAREFRIRR